MTYWVLFYYVHLLLNNAKIIKLQYSKLEIPACNKSLKPPVVISAEEFLCVLKVFKSLITPYYRASNAGECLIARWIMQHILF